MKAALSLLVFGLVAASAIQVKNVKPYEFVPGKMYVYDYSAQLLTGIPKIAEQFAGLKMKAQIQLQAQGQSEEVQMKLTHVKISQSHDLRNAESSLHWEQSESNSGEEMAQRWMKEYIRELAKPITFTHVNGQVVNFVADKSEPEWSLNIKKSILSLFHLTLSPNQVMRATEGNQIPKPVSNEDLTYYGVFESGMAGICESVYELDQIPDLRSNQPTRELVLNVTKTKNYHNCLTRSTFGMTDNLSGRHSRSGKQSFAQAVRGYYPVPTAQSGPSFPVESPVKQYTSTKYNISLKHEQAVIESIRSEGKVIYTTFGDNIMAYTHQQVTLKKVVPKEVSLGSISHPQMHEELSYQLPRMNEHYSRIAMDVPHMALFSQEKSQELTQNLPKLFASLARSVLESGKSSNTENKNAMQKVVQIVNSLAALPTEQLQGMYRAIAQAGADKSSSSATEQLTRKMFLDALALTGSNEAAQLIAQMIVNRECSSSEAREMLASLPRNMKFPTTKTLDSYLELLKHPRVASEPLMQTAVAVSFGKMVNTASTKARRIQSPAEKQQQQERLPSTEKTFADEQVLEQAENESKNNQQWNKLRQAAPKKGDLERYVLAASRLLEQADSFTKKVAAIECLAHMGAKEVLAALEPYVTGSASIDVVPGYEVEDQRDLIKERNFLRTIAIYSLAHVARKNAKQVLPLVLPVYRNTAEPHEMRLAAFTIAMLCKPQQHILESIASELHRESDKHVTNFVISAFNSIGNLTTPCQQSLAKAAAEAAESAPKQGKRSNKYSTYLSGDFYDQKRSFGMWSAAEWISTRTSPIPRAGYLAVSQISSPFHADILEFGFEAKGLEKIAQRIIGSNGIIAQLLESKKSSFGETARQQINNQWRSNLKQSAKLNVFVKLFEETSIYPLDEQMINQAIEQVESWAREVVAQGYTGTYVKVLMPSSISKVSASEIGLPVVVSHKHPLIVSLKINSFNVEKKTQSNGAYQGYEVSADIEPRIMYSSYAFVYAIEPVQKTTIGTHVEKTYQASLPLKLKLSHDHEQSAWQFTAKPKAGHEAVYHKSEALTFLSKAKIIFSPVSRDWLESAQTIRKFNSSPVKVEKTMSHPRLPVAAKVMIETEESELNGESIKRSIAKHGLIPTAVMIFRNSGLNTREVRIEIQENPEAREEQLTLRWTMDESNEWAADEQEEQEQEPEYQQADQEQNQQQRQEKNQLWEQIYNEIGSAVTGRKVQYPKQSEEQIRRQAGRWYHLARKNLQLIENQQKQRQFNDEEKEEEERSNELYTWAHKTHQVQSHRSQNTENRNQNQDEAYEGENSFLRTEFVMRGDKVCFSTRPVMACAGNNEAATTKQETLDFHCLPRASALTVQLMKDAETSVLRQLAQKRVDFRSQLTVPVTCSA